MFDRFVAAFMRNNPVAVLQIAAAQAARRQDRRVVRIMNDAKLPSTEFCQMIEVGCHGRIEYLPFQFILVKGYRLDLSSHGMGKNALHVVIRIVRYDPLLTRADVQR